MSETYISTDLRRLVYARADGLCEYCLIADEDTFFGCQIDHIIAAKHGGPTKSENLALACATCNRSKGSDIGTLNWTSKEFIPFFNPRTDRWYEHFLLVRTRIQTLTSVGEGTARILGFNDPNRLLERKILIEVGRYPSNPAKMRMQLTTS